MKKAKYQLYTIRDKIVLNCFRTNYMITINKKRMEGTCPISEKPLEENCDLVTFKDVHIIDEGLVRDFVLAVNKKHADMLKHNFDL